MDDKQQIPAQATNEDQRASTPSVYVNSEPMREEQVQNAVNFLSHPRVRGSPVMDRRSFLEKRGLTREEIDEAFRRVPDSVPSAQAPNSNTIPDGQLKPSNTQRHAPTHIPQEISPLAQSRFHWYHALLAVGVLAVSGAGTAVLVKNTIIPKLKSWIRKVVLDEEKIDSKPNLTEEVAVAAKAAAKAADDVARASQEMLNSKNDEKRYFQQLINLLDVQVREMKSMSNAIQRLEGRADNRTPGASSKQRFANGNAEFDSRSVRSSFPPANVAPFAAPNSKSYMEPWEVARLLPSERNGDISFTSKVQDNGLSNQLANVDNSVPWYRKTPQITENEKEDLSKSTPYNNVQRKWVSPQPPPVAMAEAIRRPKSAAKKEELVDDVSVVDELQRITKISESGGQVETNDGSIEISSS